MKGEEKKPFEIDNLEVMELDDADLDDVAGGDNNGCSGVGPNNGCSGSGPNNGCSGPGNPPPSDQ